MSGAYEKREYPRYTCDANAVIALGNGVMIDGKTRDISMKGIWLHTAHTLPLGREVKAKITTRTGAAGTIEVRGTVVRIQEGGLAVQFIEIEPDHLVELEKLVWYCAGITDTVAH